MPKCKPVAFNTMQKAQIFIHQYALVQIAVALLQADSDDARVLGLGVVSQGLAWGALGYGREGDAAPVGAGGSRERGRGGSHGDTGR